LGCVCLFSWSGWALGLFFEQAFVHFVEEAKIVFYFVTNVDFSLVQMAGVQKEKVTKKGKTNKGGPKGESVKKNDATNTYPFRDLLDLRLMQVGVLMVKAMMVPYLTIRLKRKFKILPHSPPQGGLPIEARFLC